MPLLEKVQFAPGRKQAFLDWIHEELSQTQGDRARLERKWENSILQWRASIVDGTADFPYVGASNLELPLTSMHADPVLADMIQTFHSPEDYWTPVAKRPDRVSHASPLREGITTLEKRFLRMRRVNSKAFLDNNILGTSVYKNNWRSERVPKRAYNADGKSEKRIELISQPQIEHVPLQRFWAPAAAWSIDPETQGGAAWCAQEFNLRIPELERWARGSNELPSFDTAALATTKKFVADRQEPVLKVQREEDKFEPFKEPLVRLFEVHARFDVDGDDLEEDIVAIVPYDLPGVLLRAIYQPNAHGRRPFHVTNYLPNFGWMGIGLAEIDEWAQDATTKLLNAQIDNALLANTRMFAVPEGHGIQPGEQIYPGKLWFVGPDESVGEIRLADVYPSLPASINQLMQFAELRSGVNELRQGNLSGLPSRTPATSLLSILREGNKRFDMIHTSIREVHSEMGLRMLQNLSQRAQEDAIRWQMFFSQALGPEDAAKVMQVLLEGVEAVEESFGISVTATSAQVNKEVEKQAFIGMLQMTAQIYSQLVQTAMLMSQVQDPIVQGTAKAAYTSGVELLTRMLERFDVQNPQSYISNLEAISNSLQANAQGINPAMSSLVGAGGLGVLGGAGGIPPQLVGPQQIGGLAGF